MKFIPYTLITITSLFLFFACTDDDLVLDTEKPTVQLATPSEHQEFEFGETITLQAILKDNLELGAYKIEIHADDDGHHHRSLTTGWSFTDTGDISGNKEFLLNKTIPIPEGNYKEGHYHLGLIVTDKAGNETQTFIEIVVGDDHHH